MLEVPRNFRKMEFHRIGWIDKRMTEIMNKKAGVFNSLRNVVTVSTADCMECCLTEISRCFKHCFGFQSSKF